MEAGSFAALDDMCGKTMEAFLSPVRKRTNLMFDVQYIKFVNYINKLEYEYETYSVWNLLK